jgi:hydrogenase expression/formation protein HypC
MCLGIPGQIIAIDDHAKKLATVTVAGIRRQVNIACIVDDAHPLERCLGDWVLVHVGFAMARIDEAEAAETLRILTELGRSAGRIGRDGRARGMKYIDEFRDPKAAQALLREIAALIDTVGATEAQPVRLMEVCGGHTHSIFRYGIEGLLPKAIELVHGPGCRFACCRWAGSMTPSRSPSGRR